jgi:hypothetical protein
MMLLAATEGRLQLADRLAAAIRDPRDARRVRHLSSQPTCSRLKNLLDLEAVILIPSGSPEPPIPNQTAYE